MPQKEFPKQPTAKSFKDLLMPLPKISKSQKIANTILQQTMNDFENSKKLPNGINLSSLRRLLAYSDRYEIDVQFWPDQIAVYIMKDQVELTDFGGSFNFAVESAIEYLNRINSKNKPK